MLMKQSLSLIGIAKDTCELLAKKGAKVAAVHIVSFKSSHREFQRRNESACFKSMTNAIILAIP